MINLSLLICRVSMDKPCLVFGTAAASRVWMSLFLQRRSDVQRQGLLDGLKVAGGG